MHNPLQPRDMLSKILPRSLVSVNDFLQLPCFFCLSILKTAFGLDKYCPKFFFCGRIYFYTFKFQFQISCVNSLYYHVVQKWQRWFFSFSFPHLFDLKEEAVAEAADSVGRVEAQAAAVADVVVAKALVAAVSVSYPSFDDYHEQAEMTRNTVPRKLIRERWLMANDEANERREMYDDDDSALLDLPTSYATRVSR